MNTSGTVHTLLTFHISKDRTESQLPIHACRQFAANLNHPFLQRIRDRQRSKDWKSIDMNPYQAPTIRQGPVPRRQLGFACVMIVTAWFSFIVISSRTFGAHGFGLSLYAVAVSWFFMTRSTSNRLWPLNKSKPTITECLVVLAICGVLHGLTLPTATTNRVNRHQPKETLSTIASGPQSGGEAANTTNSDTSL